MDISEQYTRMCERAGEIQKEWKVSWGDWVWYKLGNENEDNFPHLELIDNSQLFSCVVIEIIRRESIWLPRQDQLQEMIGTDPFRLHTIFDNFIWEARGSLDWAESMEQLWLALVYHEKYHKIWNGKDWIPN